MKRDVSSSRTFAELEDKLRLAAWWALIALFVAGIAIGTSYIYLTSRTDQLNATNADLGRQIDAQQVKEGILSSLKARTDIAKKALDAARPWGNMFPILTSIALPTQLKSISIDETAHVSLVLLLGSVDDAVTIVTNVISLAGQHVVRQPQLLTFVIKADGTVQMGISFIPVL